MELVNSIYNYCTDFMINLANHSGLSYYEVNFILFGVLYPLLLLFLLFFFLYKRRRYNKLRRS